MNKMNALQSLMLLLVLLLLAGCVTQSNVTDFTKALPDAQKFLEENPGAEIKALYVSLEATQFTIKQIKEECGQQMPEVPYWVVTITKSGQELKVYLDETGKKVLCIIKPATEDNVPKGECSSNSECDDNNPATRDECIGTPKKCSHISCSGDAPTLRCDISHGSGVQTASCLNGGWSFDIATCENISCQTNYQLNETTNQCEAVPCKGDSTTSCRVEHGTGNKTRYCIEGQWTNWRDCQSIVCDSGYQLNITNNSCEQLICIGNQTEPCIIENGTGEMTRTCNNGQWGKWSDCNISCNQGFVKSGNACVFPPDQCQTVSECNDNNACTADSCAGTPKTCWHTAKTSCLNNDGCCPSGCINSNDSDCPVTP